jgi:hypothetical protein
MLDPCRNTFPPQHGQAEASAAWQRGQHVAAKLFVGFAQGGAAGVD